MNLRPFSSTLTLGLLLLAFARLAPSVRAQLPPDHDLFAKRLLIEGEVVVRDDDNRRAQRDLETGEPAHTAEPSRPGTFSLWYTWRAPRSGVVQIDLAGSTFDTALGFYEGKEIGRLRILNRNDDAPDGAATSRLTAPVEGGADYQIAIASARGVAGSIHFVLRMLDRPVIDPQPADRTGRYAETVTFTATAHGDPPLRFQWFHEGTPVVGAGGELAHFELPLSLAVTNLTVADEGRYWVEVTNPNGGTTSRQARLSVSSAPHFLDQPDSLRVPEDGLPATFEALAAGRPPITYQWRFQGTNLPGRTGPTLVIANVQQGHVGEYSVVANNASGSVVSSNATLSVGIALPEIREQPVGVTNVVGAPVTLRVVATGSRIMDYQWFKDGNALPGQVSSNLVFAAAQVADSAAYHVRVSNSLGATNSLTVRVRILPPPPNDHFAQALPIVGTDYPIPLDGYNVGATPETAEPGHDGPPALQSVWWNWTAPARGLATLVFTETSFAPRLGVYTGDALGALRDVPYRTPFTDRTLVWLTDPGVPYHQAVDREGLLPGEMKFQFSFTTNLAPPLILVGPADKDIQECETLVLSVLATNVPTHLRYPLAYQWRRDGIPIPGATAASYRVPSAQLLDSGIYDVQVSNYGGTTTSVTCRCDVRKGPKFLLHPAPTVLPICSNTDLLVAAVGCDPITFQWHQDGRPLPNATNALLQLRNADVLQTGDYLVVATNPEGVSTSRVARVRVDPAPRIIADNLFDTVVRECSNHVFRATLADPDCRPLSYQWFFNHTNALPGANTNVLTLIGVQTNQAGLYSLVVSNLHAASTSRVARLVVSALPIIPGHQPLDRVRSRLGDSFHLEVEPQSCTPMTYRWLFNGSPALPGVTNLVVLTNVTVVATNLVRATNVVALTNIVAGRPVVSLITNVAVLTHLVSATNLLQVPMLAGTNQARLVFNRPSTNLNGRYRVEVRNPAGLALSREALVQILVPPPNDHFQDRLPIAGTNTVVTGHDVIATREPGEPRHVGNEAWERSIWWTWQAPDDDGYLTVDLGGSTYDTQLALYHGDTLATLQPIATDEDSAGNRNARIAELPVLAETRLQLAVEGRYLDEGNARLRLVFNADTNRPVFARQPRSVAVLPGGTARFEVALQRTPRFSYQWQFDGVDLPGQTNATLVVTNVQAPREGAYVCLARNKYGVTASQRALLTTGAIVTGLVTDATNKRPVPFARVSVGEGSAEVFTLTDTHGNYELAGARPGDLRADFDANRRVVGLLDHVEFHNLSSLDGAFLACAATNYFRFEDRHFRVVPGTIITNSFSLSPRLEGGLRIVLNWGLNPADLDLHVRTPTGHEIDYRNPYRGQINDPPWGQLDVDETRSYGPETVTLFRLTNGLYQVWVQKFDPSAQGSLAASQATLKIYDNRGLQRVVDVPSSGNGLVWHAFDIHGQSRELIVVNRIVDRLVAGPDPGPDPVPPLLRARRGLLRTAPGPDDDLHAGSQLAYAWSLGDGTVTNTAAPRFQHRFPRPGVFTVALDMAALVNGVLTNSRNVRPDFITVTNDPPSVGITAPTPRMLFRLNAPMTVAAHASDSDGRVTNVTFFANGRRLGADSSAPYQLEWTPTTEEVVTLTAEATDEFGARTLSAPVVVGTRDLAGNVLIVRNAPDPEITEMTLLAEEIRCLQEPLSVRILDRAEITFPLMNRFKLIVWNHLSATNAPLSALEVDLFRQCYEAGIPLYFIGEDLAAMTDRMAPDARPAWLALAHLRSAGTKIGPALVRKAPGVPEHRILYSPYSEFADFRYGGPLDAATAEPDGEVLLRAGDSPVLVAYPSSDQNAFAVRRVTQNFRVLDPGRDSGGDIQRRQLFQAAVAWLIQCGDCPVSDLQLLSLQAEPSQPEAGGDLSFTAEIAHSGPCEPTGVDVTATLPPGVRLIATSPAHSARVGDDLVFRFGRRPTGFRTNVVVTVVPDRPGPLRFRFCVQGNIRDAYPADNCRELEVEALAAVGLPPRLSISGSGAQVRIQVDDLFGRAAELQYQFAPGDWRVAVQAPQPASSGVMFLVPVDASHRLFRVRIR